MKTYQRVKGKNNDEYDPDLPEYPGYEKEDDIYNKAKYEDELDPENTYKNKKSLIEEDDTSIDDLDIPGSELDDDLEEIGHEDEENNYYSLSDNDDEEDLI